MNNLVIQSPLVWPMQHDRTGFNFLSPITENKTVNGKTVKIIKGYHPGIDINAGPKPESDLNMPVVAFSSGKIIYARNAGGGWGNLLVIEHQKITWDGKPTFTRMAHFARTLVKIGDFVEAGQLIGYCGKTGTTSPHLHLEFIIKKLPTWTSYIYGWSEDKVRNYFLNPKTLMEYPISSPVQLHVSTFPEAQKLMKDLGVSNGERPKDVATREEVWEMLRRFYALQK